jgi:para-nitrobenzyl esterase
LARHLPEVVSSDQIDMARGMTLQMIQQYAPDDITDAKLAQIDADLAKLK